MTFRERLADWITGGELTKARFDAGQWERAFWSEHDDHAIKMGRANCHAAALCAISAMETPNCAPIGKRMAKAARDALK